MTFFCRPTVSTRTVREPTPTLQQLISIQADRKAQLNIPDIKMSAGYPIPFTAALDTSPHVNKVFTIYGSVPPSSSRFNVNLQRGPGPTPLSEVACHISIRFPEGTVVLNSHQFGNWQAEEIHRRLPFHPGAHFQIMILCGPGSFKIAFNGIHFAEFGYRMPLETISHLSVSGSVQLHSVSGVVKEKSCHIQNPPVPYLRPIEGGAFPGRLLRIKGRVNLSGGRFEINLQKGPQTVPQSDATLHVSVRPSEGFIAFNTLRNGCWESETRHRNSCILNPGSFYEILILCEQDNIKIALNGRHLAEFRYRFPISFINYLFIRGETELSLVSIGGRPYPAGIATAPLSAIVGTSYFSPYEGVSAHYPTPYSIY